MEQKETMDASQTDEIDMASSEGRLRALIVEDDPTTILLLLRVLDTAGYEVVGTAVNGEEAIQVAREVNPDFILMDINMPVLNGIEATRRIMAERKIPIIMLTANDAELNLDDALEAGACCYINKPVRANDLIFAVQQALSSDDDE